MKKRITFFIIFSAIILAIGCTSNDSLGSGELVQVADAVEEGIREPIEEVKEDIVEETVEEPEEEISEKSGEEVIEEPVEEIKEEVAEEPKEELAETKEESAEQQIDEPAKEEPQEVVEEKEEEKVETKVEENKVVEDPQPEYHWILNTNTKKVHKPTCNSVKQMKEKNKKESNLSPEELKEQGYEPCKNCNPFR